MKVSFTRTSPWAQFPAGQELNAYYETQNSGCINASGRQAVYEVPGSLALDKVYLLDVSNVGQSGLLIQNWPANYNSISGIDPNNIAHVGVHTESRLIVGLNELSANNPSPGRSLINGKKVFGHLLVMKSMEMVKTLTLY